MVEAWFLLVVPNIKPAVRTILDQGRLQPLAKDVENIVGVYVLAGMDVLAPGMLVLHVWMLERNARARHGQNRNRMWSGRSNAGTERDFEREVKGVSTRVPHMGQGRDACGVLANMFHCSVFMNASRCSVLRWTSSKR